VRFLIKPKIRKKGLKIKSPIKKKREKQKPILSESIKP